MRVAAVDASGAALNVYSARPARVTGPEPAAPWAVNLADPAGRFRLLCFDLDAHDPDEAAAAERDVATLTALLTEVVI